jgi:hypothetical protein
LPRIQRELILTLIALALELESLLILLEALGLFGRRLRGGRVKVFFLCAILSNSPASD